MQITVDAPGTFTLEPATISDYLQLHRFHYIDRRPAFRCAMRAIRYVDPATASCPVTAAVAVLSFPLPCCRPRDVMLGLQLYSYAEKLRFVNAHIRTISRVIVHPSFRSLGLSRVLVTELIRACPTRYVEASARMSHAHPLFSAAGMQPVYPPPPAADRPVQPVYYLFDRHSPTAIGDIRHA